MPAIASPFKCGVIHLAFFVRLGTIRRFGIDIAGFPADLFPVLGASIRVVRPCESSGPFVRSQQMPQCWYGAVVQVGRSRPNAI